MDKYIEELARTVHDLFSKLTDPSAEEIAEAYYDGKATGGETIDGIRKRLPRIRQVLEELYEDPAYLVSEVYYKLFRNSPPETPHDARRCVAGGIKRAAAGIRRNTNPKDLIYREMLEMQTSSSAARLKKGINRITDAVHDRRMPMEVAGQLIQTVERRGKPRRPALVAQMKQIAGGQKPDGRKRKGKPVSSRQLPLLPKK